MYIEEARLIGPGTKNICRAAALIWSRNKKGVLSPKWKEAKLDSCGSVSLSHSQFLTDIKPCKEYNVPVVTLKGIGGRTQPLKTAGVLKIIKSPNQILRLLCYVFDEAVGNTDNMLLVSMSAIKMAGIDVQYHIDHSCNSECVPLKFIGEEHDIHTSEVLDADTLNHRNDVKENCPRKIYEESILYEKMIRTIFMTEIQLKNIVDRMGTDPDTKTDGDETTIKDGLRISKFSKEAMEIGKSVTDSMKKRVFTVFIRNAGNDAVFPTKNGSPKIMTKFMNHPYSYELLPEYERGEKKLPNTKAMNWEGKTYSAHVIRGFIKGTPVVERCAHPRSISKLVIVPKLAPGQAKDDPEHGFRVCVNALINKCLKPCASTIPLATDEITKLFNCRYFLQLDGMNAYWSIPVCEESKRLTAFHTPDGVYCWNRLLMGAKPSSAVQQSAYLEALDQYIDYDEHGKLRKCLLDEKGNRLRDKNGNLKTLRHKFAVYCDDIVAGSDTLEELFELFDALICCCAKAGIQVKAAKVKFGVEKVTFHNYTITPKGVMPKDVNLCTIRNMKVPTDVSLVRAFLGCSQLMSGYCKDLQIISAPLHRLTKKASIFPKPWVQGADYDVAFHRIKAMLLDTQLYLHHKDPTKKLFLEVDASDVGWGGCAYQMREAFKGDPADEARVRISDNGPRNVIQWVSKAWTEHELKLPVFYRESLARLLLLERFRNLIETNIQAGVALYTDHKPGLFESSLSNKGQLSAWRIAETADLQSLVEQHYKQGAKMLLADPLSRIGAPASGFYDPTLPAKFQALVRFLPKAIKAIKTIRVYANKDTAALSRHVQAWRTPTNPISQGRLNSVEFADQDSVFYIGVNHAEKATEDIKHLISSSKQFAILVPTGLITEIARKEDINGVAVYDEKIEKLVHNLSKVVLSQTNDTWLMKIHGEEKMTEVLMSEAVGCILGEVNAVMAQSLESLVLESVDLPDWESHNQEVEVYVETRQSRLKAAEKPSTKELGKKSRTSRKASSNKKSLTDDVNQSAKGVVEKKQEFNKSPVIQSITMAPVTTWIGKQLTNQSIPKSLKRQIITSHEKYPDGLMAIPPIKEGGTPRIIVPIDVQRDLVLQAHLDIHHQNHSKVYKLLSPLYYWPSMTKDIEDICKACEHCLSGKMRREKLQSLFDMNAPLVKAAPRQHYGIDFYGLMSGEILIMVDLFTREVLLQWLPSREQEKVARTILRRIVFERGVPLSLRSDNAPELMKGVVKKICSYLNIQQIVTGGHNPRGNAICERANQTLGNMIRKLSDKEYTLIKTHALPAFQFAMNTTYHSSIGCSPFEAGYGLPAQTISHARLLAQQKLVDGARGRDMELEADDLLEDVDVNFDKSDIKLLMELAMRMADSVRSTSEWHRRMTSNRLAQSGHKIDYNALTPGAKVYFYKPPSQQETQERGRKAKHLDHYIGPAIIVRQAGSRSFIIQYTDKKGVTRTYQRDAAMLSLVPPSRIMKDPSEFNVLTKSPHVHRSLEESPIEEGEVMLLKDGESATTWYCAQVMEKLPDRIKVSYFTTQSASLEDYSKASVKDRLKSLRNVIFSKTWTLPNGEATIVAPALQGRRAPLWTGQIPLGFLDDQLLIRSVGLSSQGKLDETSVMLAAKLNIPHHVGA